VAALALVTGVHALEAPDPDISVTPIARDGQVLVSFDLSDGMMRTSTLENNGESNRPNASHRHVNHA
jgi:hypothetical protein